MRSARGDERIRRSFWQGHGCFSPGRKWLGHRSSGATIVGASANSARCRPPTGIVGISPARSWSRVELSSPAASRHSEHRPSGPLTGSSVPH
jgi:hypothetical protein